MEKFKVFLTDIALHNLKDIPPKYIEDILDKIDLLETFPEMGIAVQKPKWLGYRQLIAGWYRILYSIDHDRRLVNIHFIKHGRMNFQ